MEALRETVTRSLALIIVTATAATLAAEPATRIVPAYESMREFALAVRKNPGDREALSRAARPRCALGRMCRLDGNLQTPAVRHPAR